MKPVILSSPIHNISTKTRSNTICVILSIQLAEAFIDYKVFLCTCEYPKVNMYSHHYLIITHNFPSLPQCKKNILTYSNRQPFAYTGMCSAYILIRFKCFFSLLLKVLKQVSKRFLWLVIRNKKKYRYTCLLNYMQLYDMMMKKELLREKVRILHFFHFPKLIFAFTASYTSQHFTL